MTEPSLSMDEPEPLLCLNLFRTQGEVYEVGKRSRNAPGGELQREHIEQTELKGLAIYVNLLTVIHGQYTPEGPPASLIIFRFQFMGSESHKRRFKKAVIDIRFENGGVDTVPHSSTSRDLDPVVDDIAPNGAFALNSSERKQEVTIGGNVGVNGTFASFLGLEIGLSYERISNVRKEERATMYGTPRIALPREYGSYNAARWTLKENKIDEHGIPTEMKVAVLLKPKTAENFAAIVDVDTEVDVLFKMQKTQQKMFGRGIVDPVYFSQKLAPTGPIPVGVERDNLSAIALKDIGTIDKTLI